MAETTIPDTCVVCQKRVYFSEKLVLNETMYHKNCFRCSKCSRMLTTGDYCTLEGVIFCKPHYIETFKLKGKYEAGSKGSANDALSSLEVIRSGETVMDEMPAGQSTKSLADVFRAKEVGEAPTPDNSRKMAEKAREHTSVSSNIRTATEGPSGGAREEAEDRNERSNDDAAAVANDEFDACPEGGVNKLKQQFQSSNK